ncbi:MAG: filamentous hemagglutinin N-terminal domain-containing protein, partial [Nitrospira sp.]|nr:filamentous hemagglutinin N-terminal domain-containing protein [Nitrospira sp.]
MAQDTNQTIFMETNNMTFPNSQRTPKTPRQSGRQRLLLHVLLCSTLVLNPAVSHAAAPGATQLPTGEQVVGGQASISRQHNTMNIDQATNRAAIDWHTFDIGSQATVNFNQPSTSSVILNRVQGPNPSQIFGQLNANGQVFLTNPNGVYFAPGANIDVGGLVATTHSLSVEEFMAGKNHFTRNGATGRIINEGQLRASLGGYIALLAPEVRNDGVIIAELGTVALAAGEAFELQFDPNRSLTGIRVDPATIDTIVENGHAVLAPDGLIILSAHAANQLHGSVVRHDGILSASSLVSKGGRVLLEGDDLKLGTDSSITATGATGGGEVLIGGGWQGSGGMRHATTVTMEPGASIDASATERGDGGTIVLWSDITSQESRTSVAGEILARGGRHYGHGGQIETSGHDLTIDASASVSAGEGGQWLLDPYNYVIDATAAGNIVTALDAGTNVTVTTTADNASFGSSGNNADPGDISVTSDIVTGAMAGDATLTLQAARHITINSSAEIDATQNGNTARLNVTLSADTDSSGDGFNTVNSPNIKTNGGDITIDGDTIVANSSPAGVTFDSDGGNIVFGGLLNSSNTVSTKVTIDAGATGTVTSGGIGGTDALTSLDVTSNGVTINGSSLVTTGTQTYDSGLDVNSTTGLLVNGTTVTTGGDLDFSATNLIDVDASLVVPGAITMNGGTVDISGTITQSATGDVWLHGSADGNPSVGLRGNFTKTAGTGTMTLKGVSRVSVNGTIDASSSDGLNVVLWSDYDGGDQGGVSILTSINTGGGHLWAGGSAATPGSDTWNGLTVGNGPSVGANGYNQNALDFFGDITTNGGDVLLWAGDGYNLGISGIALNTPHSITAGAGDITLIADTIGTQVLTINSTGHWTYKPNGTAWSGYGGTFDFDGTLSGGTYTGLGDALYLKFLNFSQLGGLTLGKVGNTIEIRTYDPIDIQGDVNLIGSRIITDASIESNGGDIQLLASGSLGTSGGDVGITVNDTLNANGGDISLNASFGAGGTSGGTDRAISLSSASITTTGSGTITIVGDATNNPNTGNTWGMQASSPLIQTESGAINITGTGGKASGNSRGFAVDGSSADILSSSGAITIHDAQPTGLTGTYTGLYLRPSSAGNINIGADGSTVTSSSSNITFQADKMTFDVAASDITTSGDVVIESVGTSFLAGLTLTNANITGDPSSLRVGKTTNTANVTFNTATVAGPVTIYGGDITINQDIDVSGASGAGILLKSLGSITVNSSAALTTTNGHVIGWSSADGGDKNGYIYLADGSSISTNGGHVWLGGSTDKGNPGTLNGDGSTTWNGLTVGNGYAASGAGVPMPNGVNWRAGIGMANATISTAGGDFYAAGMDLNIDGGSPIAGSGIVHGGTNGSISAGSGTIEMHAYAGSSGAYSMLIGLHPNGVDSLLTLTSSSNDPTAISLSAETASTDTSFSALLIEDNLTIQSTGTGGITLTGRSAATEGIRVGSTVDSGNLEALATSGTITIDTGDDQLAFFNASSQSYLGAKTGSSILSSSSEIVIVADQVPNNSANLNIKTTGTLAFQPSSSAGTGANTSADTTGWDFGSTLTGLNVGTSGKPYDTVTLGSTATINGDITLYGGTVAINAPLTATGSNTVTLTGTGSVTDGASGYLTADKLALLGGNVTLDHSSTNIGTLAASGVGTLSFTDSNALTIGTVNPTGITATGAVNIATLTGDLTVSDNISGTSITLNAGKNAAAGTATGGNLLISGSPTLTATTGNTTLYSGNVSGSTGLTNLIGSGSGNFRYHSDEAASNFTAALGATGTYAIYREQPSVTVTATDETITYGTMPATAITINSQNGDTSPQIFSTPPSISVGGSTSTSGRYTAGTHSLTIGGAVDQLGYAVVTNNGTLTVNQKTITTPLPVNNKVYDGTTAASISTTGNGVITGDVVTVNGTATFGDKNVGTGKTVNLTGLTITGTDVSNYVLSSTTGTSSANITPKALTVSGLTAANKVYDGTTSATVDHSGVTFTGLVAGDTVTAANTSGTFADKNVGTGKSVTLSGTTYGGADAANYSVTDQTSTTANITAKALTVSGLTATNKVYDGTTSATVDHSGVTFTGLVGGDTVTAASTTGTFADK